MLLCHGRARDNDSLEAKTYTKVFQTCGRLFVTFLLLEGPTCWGFGHYQICYHKVKFYFGAGVPHTIGLVVILLLLQRGLDLPLMQVCKLKQASK